jgi:hypothetical protein
VNQLDEIGTRQKVVLLLAAERAHVLGRHQSHVVAKGLQAPTRWWAPTQASMPTRQGARLAKRTSIRHEVPTESPQRSSILNRLSYQTASKAAFRSPRGMYRAPEGLSCAGSQPNSTEACARKPHAVPSDLLCYLNFLPSFKLRSAEAFCAATP